MLGQPGHTHGACGYGIRAGVAPVLYLTKPQNLMVGPGAVTAPAAAELGGWQAECSMSGRPYFALPGIRLATLLLTPLSLQQEEAP